MMRHRVFVFFALVLTLPTLALAQSESPFHAGLSLTGAVSNIKLDSEEFQFRQHFGLGIAVYVEVAPLSWLSVNVGGGIIQKGFREEVAEFGEDYEVQAFVDAETRLNYVNLPLIVKLYLMEMGGGRAFVCAGPRMSWLVSRKAGVFELSTGDSPSPFADKVEEGLQWGWTVGVGVTLPFKERFLIGVQVGYDRDSSHSMKYPEQDMTGYNETLYFGLSFGI